MKGLVTYINEAIKKLERNVKGIIVFDIDDTLLQADNEIIKIYKRKPGEDEVTLTTSEFAKDPDAEDPSHSDWYDLSDFGNPYKVYQSIVKGKPIIRNLRIMDNYLDAGYEFCFLTARQCEDIIKDALYKFLKIRNNKNGELRELGNIFNKAMSHAINDRSKFYKGTTDANKKANVLVELCSKYDKVVFVDDDDKNIKNARALKLPNLKIIKAWKN